MDNGVKFKRKLGYKGDSLALVIPLPLAEYLEVENGDNIIISSAFGKHGKYLWMQKEVDVKNEQTTGVYKKD